MSSGATIHAIYTTMTTVNKRVIRMFYAWYQPKYKMDRDDWMFVVYMILAANISMGVGFLIGMLIARFI